MSVTSIYRLACDAPHCAAVAVVEQITDAPDDWRRINSTDHLADWRPGRTVPGTRRKDQRTQWDIHSGAFSLHLCPTHRATFDAHLPVTEGSTAGRRGDRYVTVRCACGQLSRRTVDVIWVGGKDEGPSRAAERLWWFHIPEDLREYATRRAAEVSGD